MSNFPASYRPNESPDIIFAEHLWFQGTTLCAVAYGIQFVLYVITCFSLWKRRILFNFLLIAHISVIFILSTLCIAALLKFTQMSFIDYRNIPGGPSKFEEVMFSIPIATLAHVSMVISSWLCGVISVWRCWVIYKGSLAVNIVPGLLYLGTIALGILILKRYHTGSRSPWTSPGINFTIPYHTVSLALSIIITVLIVLRLLVYRYREGRTMGKYRGSPYTSYKAMIIESSAIYSAFSLLFLIPSAMHHPLAHLFIQGLSTVHGIATFLIVLRIADGKGWSRDTPITNRHTPFTERGTHTITGAPGATTNGPSLTHNNYLESCGHERTTVVDTISSSA